MTTRQLFGIAPSARLRPSPFFEATLVEGVTAGATGPLNATGSRALAFDGSSGYVSVQARAARKCAATATASAEPSSGSVAEPSSSSRTREWGSARRERRLRLTM